MTATLPTPVAIQPIHALEEIVARRMAPMAPMFAAMRSEWSPHTSPSTALRALVLMIFRGPGDSQSLCDAATADAVLRRFLHLADGHLLDAPDLATAIGGLLANDNARQFVRDIVTRATTSGLLANDAFRPDDVLIETWTSQ